MSTVPNPQPPDPQEIRRGRLAELARACEYLVAYAPIPPTSFKTDIHDQFGTYPGSYERVVGLVLYFHNSESAVRAFAQRFAAQVETERNDQAPRPALAVRAHGLHGGVPFRAWTLVDVPVVPVPLHERGPERPNATLALRHAAHAASESSPAVSR